jgi:hypothetical protein
MSRDFVPPEFDDRGRDPSEPGAHSDPRPLLQREPVEASKLSAALERSPERPLPDHPPEIPFRDGWALLYDRDRGYRLSEPEIRTIIELGKFRVAATHDLAQYAYAGDRHTAERGLRNLAHQGLVRKGTFYGPEANARELLTLTKKGYGLLHENGLTSRHQVIYYGFVKARDANHDAHLYRVYQKEAARIAGQGGRNLRVILDSELQRRLRREVAELGAAARPQIAARHGLRVVRNKIPVPDLRIEYETPSGGSARVNLELVTENYRGRHLADKVHAGFHLYTPHGEADHLRRVLDQYELTAEILSL